MRVIMLSWEYPPKIVGGISRHVFDLAHALVKQDVEVHVITCEHPGALAEEVANGIHIHRVTPLGSGNDFVHWVQLLNQAMQARGEELLRTMLGKKADGDVKPPSSKNPILLHAHDWLAHYSCCYLKHEFHLPMLATIHATEYGRNDGIYTAVQQYINSVEWELQFESWRVITCTDYMRREVQRALSTPWEKMDVVYNGVDPSKFLTKQFKSDEERASFRARYAAPEEKIIFFVGRMVREKGVQVLIEALPKVRWFYHDAKLLIVGGGHRDHLAALAQSIGMDRHVYFTGFVPDDDLLKIYQIIDVACFPSLYEPFGIVALEANAARVPVVVSDSGGFPEVIHNNETGFTTYAGNANSLADGLLRALNEPDTVSRIVAAAEERLKTDFNWDNIARQTVDVYKRIWAEYVASSWYKS